MKKLLPLFLLLALLCGCTATPASTSQPPPVAAELEDFDFTLTATGREYKKGDGDFTITVTLTYTGEGDEIEMYHAASPVFMVVNDSSGEPVTNFGMATPLVTTTYTKNEPEVYTFGLVWLDEYLEQGETYTVVVRVDFTDEDPSGGHPSVPRQAEASLTVAVK